MAAGPLHLDITECLFCSRGCVNTSSGVAGMHPVRWFHAHSKAICVRERRQGSGLGGRVSWGCHLIFLRGWRGYMWQTLPRRFLTNYTSGGGWDQSGQAWSPAVVAWPGRSETTLGLSFFLILSMKNIISGGEWGIKFKSGQSICSMAWLTVHLRLG